MFLDLDKDPGTGNLNVRAYLATLVGPGRVLFGQHPVKRLTFGKSYELAKNTVPNGMAAQYVEIWLTQAAIAALPSGGAFLSFSNAMLAPGAENSQQLLLSATQRFRCVLLSNEILYGAAMTDAAGGALAIPVSVVVASVTF